MFDQDLSEVGENPPISLLAGVEQIVSGNPTADSHVVHFFRDGVQTGNNVSKAFAIGQLGKCHDAKVIGTLESLNITVSVITVDAGLESSPRQTIHDLCKTNFPWFMTCLGSKSPEKSGKKLKSIQV